MDDSNDRNNQRKQREREHLIWCCHGNVNDHVIKLIDRAVAEGALTVSDVGELLSETLRIMDDRIYAVLFPDSVTKQPD